MDEMSTTMDFEEELEVFRTEEEVAQQYFFAYLSVRSLAASSKDVLANMNTTPLFWRTTHHAMLVAAFLALGRIFDQDPKSDHNIDKLMRAASAAQAQGLFSKAALAQRKTGIGLSAQQIADYVDDKYELTAEDVRDLRKEVAQWRKIYEERYRDVRHMVFAHKRRDDTVEKILAKTNIEELKDLLGFLSGLYSALDQLYLNGRKPEIEVRKFVLPPSKNWNSLSPGERVFAEGQEVLRMVAVPDPDEQRLNAGIFN
jgi:AbiU2